MSIKSLQFQQLDQKMQKLHAASEALMPRSGWIHAIREAIGMSVIQLGKRLNLTRQSVYQLEHREKDGAITLKSLKEVARVLDMDFVYGFVPKDGSLEKLVERKARALAERIVNRTSASMKLEDQENSSDRIEQAIIERMEQIIRELPPALWD